MSTPVVEALLRATERAVRADDGSVTVHAPGPGLVPVLSLFESRTQHVVRNMQRSFSPSVNRAVRELDLRSRGRGVREMVITDRGAAETFPLATSVDPELRVGPVPVPLMVSDDRVALLAVPLGRAPEGGCCWTTDPDLVRLATEAFDWSWERSVPWQEAGLRAPLSERRFRIAVLLVDGSSDREIAAELGIGERTVSGEVRAIVDWLGARNRTHAVAMLVGAA